jgi:hypothetical protein
MQCRPILTQSALLNFGIIICLVHVPDPALEVGDNDLHPSFINKEFMVGNHLLEKLGPSGNLQPVIQRPNVELGITVIISFGPGGQLFAELLITMALSVKS